MESEHRKIELQSPGDLTYIQTQIRRAARQKLDLHLPPVQPSTADPTTSAPEPDELRRKTEELVDIFVAQVLDGMRQNVSINGMDVVDNRDGLGTSAAGLNSGIEVEVEEYEDLDNKLRERLRATIAKRDALIGKIAQHRRTTPAAASVKFRAQFEAEMAAMESARAEAERAAGGMEGREGEVVGVEGLERAEEVERSWERAVEGLMRLNTGLPETRARLERAGDVVGYLEGKKKGGS